MIDVPPRTFIDTSASGEPCERITCTPATLPLNAWVTSEIGTAASSLAFTEDTEPVRSFRLTVAYPIFTTSSSSTADDSRVTLILR